LDYSSPIHTRSPSPLEPIPTLAFPPLTLPRPEDPTVLTLGLPQPSSTTSGFTFTREDLVRFREGGYRRSHDDEDEYDHDHDHDIGHEYGHEYEHEYENEYERDDQQTATRDQHTEHMDNDNDNENENENENENGMGGRMVRNKGGSQSRTQIRAQRRSGTGTATRPGTGLAARVAGASAIKPRDNTRMVLVEAAWRKWEESGWLSRGMGAIGARAFDKKGQREWGVETWIRIGTRHLALGTWHLV
jgi:hypothetical protein